MRGRKFPFFFLINPPLLSTKEFFTTPHDGEIMSCNCKLYQRRLDKLQKKYSILRKNHKKLLGVTVVLTDALEQFVKGDMKTGVNDILLTCSSVYPDLFEKSNHLNQDKKPNNPNLGEEPNVKGDDQQVCDDPVSELEKEYYEGFMSRPRIPRSN